MTIEKQGLEPLHMILKRLGGWPVLDGDSWNDGDFDWKTATYKFREVGYSVDYFIDFSIGVDLKNSTTRVIDVGIRYAIKTVFDGTRMYIYIFFLT